jgi:putative hemolysin
MNELPNPTMPLSYIDLPRGSLHQPCLKTRSISVTTKNESARRRLVVEWAQNLDQVRAAQRLRYQVFAIEMGARLQTPIAGHDVDVFDDFCEHLLIRDEISLQIIGTYRVLTPAQAKRIGGTYSDTEFDLSNLNIFRDRMVELGRSCVHQDHRDGGVIMALWAALAEFMTRNELDVMIGCASIPMLHQGAIGGEVAASIWHKLKKDHLAPAHQWVTPKLPLPIKQWSKQLDLEPPGLIKGYLRLGAKILGEPAWDPDFNTADLPMLMRIADMPTRYRKHFLGA